jgi:multidrug resistance efflux pump
VNILQAQRAVEQAQAEIDLLDIQISKLTLYAPLDGRVMTSSIQPGEVIQPVASLMTIGQIDNLTITVFIPEDRYGEIYLGQSASVSADSFPGETFHANVVHISDQAEYTPRNVQTEEGRRTTVYAIKLSVEDPQGKLKPGMPADVVFTE